MLSTSSKATLNSQHSESKVGRVMSCLRHVQFQISETAVVLEVIGIDRVVLNRVSLNTGLIVI